MKTPKQCFDRLMLKTWSMLKRDFRTLELESNPLTTRFDFPDPTTVTELRDITGSMVVPYTCDAYYFKRIVQLRDLTKRYIFEKDIYDESTLSEKTIQKFLSTQARLINSIPCTERARAVIKLARLKVRKVLGEYSLEEHVSLSRFSRNATTLSPRAKAAVDLKLTGPISGSVDHLNWFSTVLEGDALLRSFIGPQAVIESLDLALAPKRFDTKRTITPNSTVGSYYTYGLGKMIENRIKHAPEMGIDLSRQQDRHRVWIKKYSITRSHVTADLSAASDSFTSCLVNALVPREWFRALKLGRISHVKSNKKCYHMSSFMAMGIGFTFPLQTLLFWAILKSIQELTEIAGKVSVFGDDLIYPRAMHTFVVGIFSDLGFILNKDKTFVQEYFRESCGSDFYYGFDVRPAMPEASGHLGFGLKYLAELYKLLNSLLRRWDFYEIPTTIKMLLKEIQSFGGILRVPENFPDYSGLKFDVKLEWHWDFKPFTYDKKLFCFTFEFLSYTPERRLVKTVVPYLWEFLRAKHADEREVDPWKDSLPDLFGSPSEMLRWVPDKWKKVVLTTPPGSPTVRVKKLRPFAPVKDVLMARFVKGLTPSNLGAAN